MSCFCVASASLLLLALLYTYALGRFKQPLDHGIAFDLYSRMSLDVVVTYLS